MKEKFKSFMNANATTIFLFVLIGLPAIATARPFIVGADVSWTLEQESRGTAFFDEGEEKDLFQILKDHRFNFIRIRTFVDPCAPDGYARSFGGSASECWCDLEHTAIIAQRIKEAEMGFLLDFHMSDTWASIGEQHAPSAWENLSDEEMREAAYEYTNHAIDSLIGAGLRPDMVQVGNEINSCMSGVCTSNWSRFAALVNAGVRGVRDADSTIKIVIQHGRPRPDGNFMNWVEGIVDNEIDFDFIGGSTYGTTNNGNDWRDQFGRVISEYGYPVMSLEYTANRTGLIHPVMNELPDQMGMGTFAWEPTQYDVPMFSRVDGGLESNDRLDEVMRFAEEFDATQYDWVQTGIVNNVIKRKINFQSLQNGSKAPVKLELFSLTGKKLHGEVVNPQSANDDFYQPNIHLDNGIYVIKATVGEVTAIQRVNVLDNKLGIEIF